MARSWRI